VERTLRELSCKLGDAARLPAIINAVINIELLRNIALIQKEAESRSRSTSRRERECETRIAAKASKLRKEIAKHPRLGRWSDDWRQQLQQLIAPVRHDPQPRARSAQGTLLTGLIDLWCAAGGAMTASVNSEQGGPLIRFLIACSSDLFDLTASGARQRIRTYKRDRAKK
jgi:hypothetical protein